MKLRFSQLRRSGASSKVMSMKLLIGCALLIAGCKDDATGTTAETESALVKMTAFKDQMCACKDAACAKKVSAEMAAWGSKNTPTAMSSDDQVKANEVGMKIGECMMDATSGTGMAAGSAAPPATGSGSAAPPVKNTQGLPKECDDYKSAIDRLSTCEPLPAAARETFVKGYQEAATRWASMPESSKTTLATACQGGVDAVLAVAKARCGW